MSPAEPETVSLADGADGTAATDPEGTLRLLGPLTLPCPFQPFIASAAQWQVTEWTSHTESHGTAGKPSSLRKSLCVSLAFLILSVKASNSALTACKSTSASACAVLM